MALRPPRPLHLWVLVLLVGGALSTAAVLWARATVDAAPPTPPPTTAPTPTPTPTPEPDVTFTIVAGGDILPHMPVLSSARTADGYDFSPLLSGLDPWVQGADLALCHMEVPVAPQGRSPSGYPLFGTVPDLVRDLDEQGWDGCSTASNHAVDQGAAGVDATLTTFDTYGLGHAGTARTEPETSPQLYQLTRGGQTITIAHIAATYATNGMPVNPGWSVELIDTQTIIDQAAQARADGADMVLVSLHCCVEYRTDPTPEQVGMVETLAASGVIDLVIGHHAHVPGPVQLIPGGVDGRGMWAAYGLGNYVSNQDQSCCVAQTSSGELLVVHVTATGMIGGIGPPTVTSVEYVPITVDRRGQHHLYALTAIPAGAGALSAAEVSARLARVQGAAGDQVAVATAPPTPTGDPPTVVARQP
jgi:poly-gamma-glutamate capsule biosynthesis protein CapA/YwtB (metallophosphatase superfamily)